ncbi:hypothetical protein COLO4_17604 [Corchorus olitorius]|uniref:RRM domain-containing protein n=1 Tax=Corchorus olitorius TaxID=93759 RepID=A0A1R3JCB2_9ROSI|nr:hypothetical protein COLO4_17604 [Corchorus olitorius]
MDPTKKRKLDENGIVPTHSEPDPITKLSPQDARKLVERFSVDQLLNILQDAVARHFDVLSAVRSIADQDTAQRKLFIRGLGWDTTTDGLRSLFSAYGELEEAAVINDKTTGKSKGKKIDGRVTVTQLAAAGNSATNNNPADVHMRKIYVANVPYDMPADKLLGHFAQYGEIEEGPLGFDKQTGKSRGFALFVYKTPDGAQAALVEPVKNIDGRQMNCKLAIEGKKGKPGPDGMMPSGGGAPGNAPGAHGGGYGGPGGPGGLGGYGYSGGLQGPPGPMGGLGGAGGGSSMYRLPPSSVGVPSGGYPESGHYSLSSSSAFAGQHHQGAGTSPVPRVPPGGMYPNGPPFY